LKIVTAKVDVALSKASLASDTEKFLLGEIENLGKAMECKFLQAPNLFFLWLATPDHLFLSNADACLDHKAETCRVNAHLRAAQTHANSITDNFWSTRPKAMKLTILQDRISQAGALAEMSHAALALVHKAMFPLNDRPDGLPSLLNRFENGEAIYRFIHEHLRCGTLVAHSFPRAHYPEVNMNLMKTLPPTPSGRVEMDAHYSACGQADDSFAR
jgi:hypothetical protein